MSAVCTPSTATVVVYPAPAGEPLRADSADVIIGPHASGVRFRGEG